MKISSVTVACVSEKVGKASAFKILIYLVQLSQAFDKNEKSAARNREGSFFFDEDMTKAKENKK